MNHSQRPLQQLFIESFLFLVLNLVHAPTTCSGSLASPNARQRTNFHGLWRTTRRMRHCGPSSTGTPSFRVGCTGHTVCK
ncbi:hypothetical protein EDC01DRAFT_678497 [Geopyxis carbonaria]|nr:hypothetical protein EDC01DRAFT_678497 [Geopyxis carbonaria]